MPARTGRSYCAGIQCSLFTYSLITAAVLVSVIKHATALGNSESITSVFVDRVSQCQSPEASSSFVRDCAHTYTIGVANAIRLLSTAPTKVCRADVWSVLCCTAAPTESFPLQTTEDAIVSACVSGCVHAVSSQLSDAMRDDTPCAQSVNNDVGQILLPMGLSLCAEGSGFSDVEFVDGSNLCYTQLTQVISVASLDCSGCNHHG